MKRAVVLVVIVLISFMFFQEFTEAEPIEKIDLVMNYMPSVDFTPFYVAQKMGFYEKNGLDVKLDYVRGSNEVIKIISQRDRGIGIAMLMAVFISSAKDIPVTAVATIYQHNPICIFTYADKGIVKAGDFNGKSIAVGPVEVVKQQVEMALELSGADVKNISFVKSSFNSRLRFFLERKTDAAICFIHDLPIFSRMFPDEFKLEKIRYFMLKDLGLDIPSNSLVVNKSFAMKYPVLVKGFTKTTIEALDFTRRNPEKAVQVLEDIDMGMDMDLKLAVLKKLLPLTVSEETEVNGLGYISPNGWKRILGFVERYKIIDDNIIKNLDSTGYTNQFLK